MSRLRTAVYEFLNEYDGGTGTVRPYFIEAMRQASIADAEEERLRLLRAERDQLGLPDSLTTAERVAIVEGGAVNNG
jgi:hypothetical protein